MGEIILGYLGRPNGVTGVFMKRGRRMKVSIRRLDDESKRVG